MVENAFPILLADAHTCSRIGLYQVLMDAGFHVVAEAEDLEECRALLAAHQPNLLLLASNLLPDQEAPSLAGLRQRYPETMIVLLLDADIDWPLKELAAAGAGGMVMKSESSAVIVQTVRMVVTGGPAFSPELSARMLTLPDTPTVGTQDVALTAQEQKLLQFLCADKSNPEIAQALHLSRKTVEKRLTALYKKLGVKSRTGAVAWHLEQDK